MEVPIPLRSSLVQASRVVILLAIAICVSAKPGPQKPAVVAKQFYIWYVGALLADRDPIDQDHGTLEKYVAPTMLAAITRRMASSDGLDSDPFIQAQDYVDDWKTVTAVWQRRGSLEDREGSARPALNMPSMTDRIRPPNTGFAPGPACS